MIESYKTVRETGSKEIVIKKSRFIGHVMPVTTEAQANAFIDDIKKQHWNATHNCSAYMLGERNEIQKQSDDGEPSGTAGKPILEVIRNQGLSNVAIVVTRYFGGIMLGAGGLIRAYTDGAVVAIESGDPITRLLHRQIYVDIDYTWLAKIENELRNQAIRTGETLFTERVKLVCLPKNHEVEKFKFWITDFTQGQSVISEGEQLYFIEGE
ncbi:YigZ family protein [Paenibacillus sp. CMAA1364]